MAIKMSTKMDAYRSTGKSEIPSRMSRKTCWFIIVVAFFLLVHYDGKFGLPYQVTSPNLKEPVPSAIAATRAPFDYTNITPSKSLVYHDCFDGYQCARLSVPLDWNSTREDGGPKAALAIIKMPAAVPVTDPRYGGVILLNPGGPGWSGVDFVLGYGDTISMVVNSPIDPKTISSCHSSPDRYFDILSWDPRGVNHTTPAVQCFSDSFHRESWQSQLEAIGFDLSEDAVFNSIWSRVRGRSAICSQPSEDSALDSFVEGEHIGQFVSTANVVRDMVEIVERHGEWREKEALYLNALAVRNHEQSIDINHLVWNQGEEKLQYWGFSYGTLLGQTFASMQPHRVHRAVLDGVVDAQDYTKVGWSTNLNDVDLITSNFVQECFDAGPDQCAVFHKEGPDTIAANTNNLIASLRIEPLITSLPSGPAIITASAVVHSIFNNWYSPTAQFRPTASLLANLMAGNASDYAAQQSPSSTHFCKGHSSPLEMAAENRDSSTLTIVCTDGDDVTNTTREEYKAYVAALSEQSSMFSNWWSTIRLSCTAYAVHAKWRFTGPYGATTAHPILFASQRLDPVTPLRNAVRAAALFPGAGLLQVDGMGHDTLAMPSVCGAKVIRKYFQTGEIEGGKGTKCPIDKGGFDIEAKVKMAGYDGVLLKSLEKMAETWPWQKF